MMSGQVQMFPSLVQYVAMQRETNNNIRKTPLGPVRCLFGVPDRNETKVFIEEELRKQRERFFKQWEFSLEHLNSSSSTTTTRKRSFENDENASVDENSAKRLILSEDKFAQFIINGEKSKSTMTTRRVLQPRNDTQSQITDFWSTKKTSPTATTTPSEEKLIHKPQKCPKNLSNL